MKKTFLAFILLAVTFSFPSCHDDQPCVTTKTFDVQVRENEWTYSNINDNNYFYATIAAPEITWSVYDNAQVMVYREWNRGANNATKKQLPYSLPYEYSFETEDGPQWGFYTEILDYEYTQGQITIFYTASDFVYEFNPESMDFRVVIMYNH